MNLQEQIRKVLREEYELPNFIIRRFKKRKLDKLVLDIDNAFKIHNIPQSYREEVIDAEVEDFIMNSVYYERELEYLDNQEYQERLNLFVKPLVGYVKKRLGIL